MCLVEMSTQLANPRVTVGAQYTPTRTPMEEVDFP